MFDPTPIVRGDRLALARLLTQIENDLPVTAEAQAALYPSGGGAHIVGVTGPPGTGKSTLINALALAIRRSAAPRTVAIVAVDPTSPYTGGALLGDRVRMLDLAGDPGVFIRSMATRGALGGLARKTSAVVDVLDAAGFQVVLIETVGTGQAEADVARTAHTTVVVDVPGLGDDVQAMKAGVLETADILVVNKADRAGADEAAKALRGMLELAPRTVDADDAWTVPVCQMVASTGQGVPDVLAAIDAHREVLRSPAGDHRERARRRAQMEILLRDLLVERWQAQVPDGALEATLERVLARRVDPQTAVQSLLEAAESVPATPVGHRAR